MSYSSKAALPVLKYDVPVVQVKLPNRKECFITKNVVQEKFGTYAEKYFIFNHVVLQNYEHHSFFLKETTVFPIWDNLYVVPKIENANEGKLIALNHLLKFLPYEIVQKIANELGACEYLEYITSKSFPFEVCVSSPIKYQVERDTFVSIKALMTAVLLDKMELAIIKPHSYRKQLYILNDKAYDHRFSNGKRTYIYDIFETREEMHKFKLVKINQIYKRLGLDFD